MALSADTPRAYQLGDIQYYPVKASTKIYEGAAVGLDSGYARGLVDGDTFVGFALEQADNSAVATDGYINVKVAVRGRAALTITSVAVTNVGAKVYASDDGTFTLTSSPGELIGHVSAYKATNEAYVEFYQTGV